MMLLLGGLLLLYCAAALIIFVKQRDLLFPAASVGPSPPLPKNSSELTIVTADGDRIRGILLPAAQPAPKSPLIVGFPGNAWNGHAAAVYLHDLYLGSDVLLFNYRGYRPSEGSPGASALLADAPLVYDLAKKVSRDRKIVAVGFSIGTGVAAHLASVRSLDGLILVTPFDSLSHVAQSHFRWLPARLLLRHEMRPIDDLSGSRVPVAVIAAEKDRIIPQASTAALVRKIPNLAMNAVIAGRGHNEIYQDPVFRKDMAKALILLD